MASTDGPISIQKLEERISKLENEVLISRQGSLLVAQVAISILRLSTTDDPKERDRTYDEIENELARLEKLMDREIGEPIGEA